MKRSSSVRATSSTSRGGRSTAASLSMRFACSPPRVLRATVGSIRIINDAEDAEAIVQRLEEKLREFTEQDRCGRKFPERMAVS